MRPLALLAIGVVVAAVVAAAVSLGVVELAGRNPQVLRSARRMYPGDAADLVQHAFTTFTASFPLGAFPTSHGCQ